MMESSKCRVEVMRLASNVWELVREGDCNSREALALMMDYQAFDVRVVEGDYEIVRYELRAR